MRLREGARVEKRANATAIEERRAAIGRDRAWYRSIVLALFSLFFSHLFAELRDGRDVGDVVEDARAERRLRQRGHRGDHRGVRAHGDVLDAVSAVRFGQRALLPVLRVRVRAAVHDAKREGREREA